MSTQSGSASSPTPTPMSRSLGAPRPRPFLIGKIAQLVGGREKLSELTGISKDTIDNAANPEKNRELTVRDTIALIQTAGAIRGNLELDTTVDEYSRHFIAVGRRIIADEVVKLGAVFFEAIHNGGRLSASNIACPECHTPLTQKGFIDNVPVYSCAGCRAKVAQE